MDSSARLILNRSFPHYSKYWAASVVKYCCANYQQNDFNLIVATHPYTGTLLAGKEIAEQLQIPWIADFRDPWTHDMQSPWRNDPCGLEKMWVLEGETLSSAAAVVSINRQMCEYLNASKEKFEVIPNSFEPLEYQFSVDQTYFDPDHLNLCYTGSIADDHEYRLLLDGLKVCQKRGLYDISLHYYGGAFHFLNDYAAEIHLDSSCLRNHGMVPQLEANQRLTEADIGVVLGWRGPLAKLVSTGKIFEVLGMETPILGVCATSGSGMEDIITQSGRGVVLTNKEQLADTLEGALKAKKSDKTINFLPTTSHPDGLESYTTTKTARVYYNLFRKVIGSRDKCLVKTSLSESKNQ